MAAAVLAKTDEVLPLAGLLSSGATASLRDGLTLVLELARQVSVLHDAGRIHGGISIAEVLIDPQGRPHLSPPPANRKFGREHSGPESCPPDLARAELITLPTGIEAAAEVLRASGRSIDPRRIDLYQLGVLLHRLLTGASILQYMYSAKGKGQVPPAGRAALEGSLGFDPARRFDDCRPLIRALEEALQAASIGDTATDRGAGIVWSADTLSPGARGESGRPAGEPLPFERLGPYRILARIGCGGMGDVYLGHDDRVGRDVAIKVLPPELARQKEFVRRFQAEAAAVARLSHPNVVQVYEVGEDRGLHYFAMQYVEGPSLAERLARQGPLPLEEAIDVASQCLAGLEAAHAAGLIHRDVKPGNVLIEARTGRVLLVDFGVVRRLDASQATAAGLILGTLSHLAPEQARGLPADARADLYAVGVLLYQMLSGRLPFTSETLHGMLFQHAFGSPPPLEELAPHVPPRVAAIVARLMAKDPADRYASCAEALADLVALGESPPPEATDAPSRRGWLKTAIGGGLVLAAASAAVWGRRFRRRQPVPAAPMALAAAIASSEPLPAGSWIDLLPRIDLARDRVHGVWECDGSALRSEAGTWSRIMLPVHVAGGYDLRVEFTRQEGEGGEGNVEVFLPAGMDACSLSLSGSCQVPGYAGRVHGLCRINGKGCGENAPQLNPTAQVPGHLENGRRYAVLAQVRLQDNLATVRAELDGRPLVDWTGRQAALDLHPSWRLFEPRRPGVGAGWNPVVVHSAQLRVVSGCAWAAEARQPGEPVRPGADGSVLLGPRTAEIHGQFLAEGSPGVLGTWIDTDDWLCWQFHATPGRPHALELRYACHEGSQGSTCEATIIGPDGQSAIVARWVVEATGLYWDVPRTRTLGAWRSGPSGPYTLCLKPSNKLGQAVMAFHWLRLMPAE